MEQPLHPRLQHHRHRRLRHPICDRRHAEDPLSPPARLRYRHRPHRRREVAARGHPVPDLVQVVPQILLELLNRAAIHARRALVDLDPLERVPHEPLRNHKRFLLRLRFAHSIPPGHVRLPEQADLDGPAPSLGLRYRGFVATTSQSECEPRNGTQRLTVSAACRAPSRPCTPAETVSGPRPPTFRVKAADRARVAYMPGTTWPVSGYPPGSS